MELLDGLNCYKSDREFWNFTSRLENDARQVMEMIQTFGTSPSDDALRKAHDLLVEIELWKAGCIEDLTGHYAVRNSKPAVWNSLRDAAVAMRAHRDVEALLAVMRLEGFGKYPDEDNQRRAKRASAVLRIINPHEWGVVDWRTAAMCGLLDKSGWDLGRAVAEAENEDNNKLRWTFDVINEEGARAYNQMYRDKRSGSLPRTADVEMAIFGLSCMAWPFRAMSKIARKPVA